MQSRTAHNKPLITFKAKPRLNLVRSDKLDSLPRPSNLPPSFVKVPLGRICLREFADACELFQVLAAGEKTCTMLQPARNLRFSHDAVRELDSFFTAPPLTSVFDLRTIFLEDLIVYVQDRHSKVVAVLMLSLVHSCERAPRLGMRIDYVGSLPGHSEFNFFQVLCNAAEQFMAFRIMLDDNGDRLTENYKLVSDLMVYLLLVVKKKDDPFPSRAGFSVNEQGEKDWLIGEDELVLERAVDLRIGERLVDVIDGALEAA